MRLSRHCFLPLLILVICDAPTLLAGVHWSGPGGDIWNTNSSPYSVDPTRPFGILWSSYSREGQFHRASGVALARVGPDSTFYIFGSTGWGGNRVYRRLGADGSAPDWTTQEGENDSGTGFRIALSPDAGRVYHIDVGTVIRAYPTATDPYGEPLWTVRGDQSHPGLANMVKVGPDGRIYGHFEGTAALDPADGSLAWQSAGSPEDAVVPGAFFNRGPFTQYVVAGRSRTIAAYDIASPSGSSPVWTYLDQEDGFAGPTIDPVSGSVYVFRSSRVIKLGAAGGLLWESATVGSGEWGRSYGALSRDRQTYYYQTGGPGDTGKLYAFRTSDGSLKWSYATMAGGEELHGGPVVSANGILFVANGAAWWGDNRIYCIQDTGEAPAVVDTFDLREEDAGAPWISIGPGGIVYTDCLALPDDALLFAFQTQPMEPPPANLTAIPYYSTAHLQWDDDLNDRAVGYAMFRRAANEEYPQAPTKVVGPRSSFTDYGLTPGATYFYRIASHDAHGVVNSPFAEVSLTLGTDPDAFSRHANLELLLAVYTQGWTPEEVQYHVNGIIKGLEFFWRTSGVRLNMDPTWMFIDAPIPNRDGDYGPIVDDLRTRGIRDHQYDLLYTIGPGLGPCLGGYTLFGSTKASLGIVCGVPYPGKDPSVDYTLAWTFTHELNHAMDILCDAAGAQDMLFNHFPWNYPVPLDGSRHVDWGTHYDGISALMRLYADYDVFGSYYDGKIECVDSDADGLPDSDARVPIDEVRFGSPSITADGDYDGLDDLEELTRYNFKGTDPRDPDTDDDGVIDGLDPQPLYKSSPYLYRAATPPLVDGSIEPGWPLLADGYYFTQSPGDFTVRVYVLYDADALYLAFRSSRKLRFMVSIDGSASDGRFESDVRHPDGTTDTYNEATKPTQFGDSWGDGNHLYTYHGASGVEVWGVGPVPGSEVRSTSQANSFETEVRIPRSLPHGCGYTWYLPDAPVADGLRLEFGRAIGLNVTFSDYAGSGGEEFSGIWTSLFETHSYVDFTLTGTVASASAVAEDLLSVPNPLHPGSILLLGRARPSSVSLDLYDVAGRCVATLRDRSALVGEERIVWTGKDGQGRRLAPGVYLIRLQADERKETRKVLVLP